MVPPHHFIDTYSKEDVAKLCQTFSLHPDDLDEFRNDLETSAAIYRWESKKYSDLPNRGVLTRDFTGLANAARRLGDMLENLPEETEDIFIGEIGRQTSREAALLIGGKLQPDDPALLIPVNLQGSNAMAICLDFPDLKRIIRGLENTATSAIETLPKRRRGQMRNWGLRLWMTNMKMLWECTTDQPFTRDVTDAGDPITPAASFCVAAFHHIAPDYPQSRILREMKDCIQRSRQATGQIISKTED